MSLWFYFMLCNARKSSRQQRVNRKGVKTDFYIRSAFCGKLNDAPFVRNCNILPQWDNSYRRTLTWCDVCRGCTGLKPFRPCTACPTWGRINSTSIGVVHQINLRCGENRQQQTSAIVTAPQTITKWNKSSLSQLKLMWWRCRHSTNEYQLVPCANCVCEGGGERERASSDARMSHGYYCSRQSICVVCVCILSAWPNESNKSITAFRMNVYCIVLFLHCKFARRRRSWNLLRMPHAVAHRTPNTARATTIAKHPTVRKRDTWQAWPN